MEDHQIKVLEAHNINIECESPLEISTESGNFASNYFAKIVVAEICRETAYVVLNYKVKNWQNSSKHQNLKDFLGLSELDFIRWERNESHLSSKLEEELLLEFLEHPELYKEDLNIF